MASAALEHKLAKVGARPANYDDIMFAPSIMDRLMDRELFEVDFDTFASRYIGETEKHLKHLLRLAAQAGAVLLLDHAELLLEKRSEVRDAHDRYADIDLDDLVGLVESTGGTVFLATNRKADLDSAFLRRLRFVIEFPRPQA